MKPRCLRRAFAALAATPLLLAIPAHADVVTFDFEQPDGTTDIGAGTELVGNANFSPSIQGGRLHLTTNSNSNNSAFHIPAIADSSTGFTITFDYEMGDDAEGNPPADGFAFSYGNIPFGFNSSQPEEGWPGELDVLSWEMDTWNEGDTEVGPAIGLNRPADFGGSSLHPSSLGHINGPIFTNGTSISGTVSITFEPGVGTSFSTTGAVTNAAFLNVPTPGFTADDNFTFAIAARTGGANEDLFIDNLVICIGLPDSDGDGLSDSYETSVGLDPNDATGDNGAAGDPDGDGLTNIQERDAGTNPTEADSDGDGLDDNVETNTGTWVSASDTGTDPLSDDTDGDGLLDGVETNTGTFVDANDTGTDPNNPNSDGDSLNDGVEAGLFPGRDPNVVDDAGLYRQDFDAYANDTIDLADGTTIVSQNVVASVQDGELLMTTNTNSNNAAFHIPGLAGTSTGFIAKFDYSIMDNTGNPPADGFSFSYGAIPVGGLSGVAEEGWPGVTNILSFEMDTWQNGSAEVGPTIGVDDATVATNNGDILPDGSDVLPTMISGTICITVADDGTASFSSTGAQTNANFEDIETFFGLDDTYTFSITARTGGANQEVRIDNLVIAAGLGLDDDGDGLNNAYELLNGLNPDSAAGDDGAAGDPDGDGVSNIDEQANGSNPQSDDTDGDGLKDGVETNTGTFVDATDTGSDPTKADTDGDGLRDGVETGTGTFVNLDDTGTDPNNPNTDGDNLDDGIEANLHPARDPNVSDEVNFYTQNFDDFVDGTTDLGDGSNIAGTAVVIGGKLQMTTNTNNNNGAFHIPGLPGSSTGWTAKFNYSIMDNSGNPPADGFAFSYGGIPVGGLSATAEEGWPGVANILSFEMDTWRNGDAEVGPTIGVDDATIETINGDILADGSAARPSLISGVVCITVAADGTATFTTTGAQTNADFTDVDTQFILNDDFTFAISARTGGANEEVLIDDIVVVTGDFDTDGDGLSNAYEIQNGLNPASAVGDDGADGDPDGDGLTNLQESQLGTNPQSDDTDGDGLLDGVETGTGIYVDESDTGTSPSKADSDGDGFLDGVENPALPFVDASQPGTDPNRADTDGDGLGDADEIAAGRNPTIDDQPRSYSQNFDSFPDGATDFGDGSLLVSNGNVNASVQNGELLLTENTNSNDAAFHIPALKGSSGGFTVKFDYSIEDNTGNNPADGFALSYGAIPWGGLAGVPEEGWPGVSPVLSFEMDTWQNGDAEVGPAIAVDDTTIDTINGNILEDDTRIEGQICIVVRADGTADYVSTGAVTNAEFFEVDFGAAGFELDDAFSFAIAARTGGANQEVRIDNVVITIGSGPGIFLDIENEGADQLRLRWASKEGKSYDLITTTDPSLEVALWDVAVADILGTPDENVEIIDRPGDPTRFYRVVEKEGPPLYEEGFEAGDGGWTATSDGAEGTAWELGSPSNVGPATGANGSANAWGTNISANYAFDANVTLTSPPIDLSAIGDSGAKLVMQHFPDIEDTFDFGTIKAIRASDGTPLADVALGIDDDTVPPSDWSEFSVNLPSEVNGETIQLQFIFQSDNIQNQAGWYIDDVTIRAR